MRSDSRFTLQFWCCFTSGSGTLLRFIYFLDSFPIGLLDLRTESITSLPGKLWQSIASSGNCSASNPKKLWLLWFPNLAKILWNILLVQASNRAERRHIINKHHHDWAVEHVPGQTILFNLIVGTQGMRKSWPAAAMQPTRKKHISYDQRPSPNQFLVEIPNPK